MADSDNAQARLAELRGRWEADRSSRLFLQLAEEYRRQGMPEDAIPVLEEGLRVHPASGAAQVALGRCRLEAGQVNEAVEILEGVVRRDPTQMVAYRALIDCYLQSGDVERARDRLGLYTQLNPQDPDIDKLGGQIDSLESAGGTHATDTLPAPASEGSSEPPPPPHQTQSMFFAEPPPPAPPDIAGEEAAAVALPSLPAAEQDASAPPSLVVENTVETTAEDEALTVLPSAEADEWRTTPKEEDSAAEGIELADVERVPDIGAFPPPQPGWQPEADREPLAVADGSVEDAAVDDAAVDDAAVEDDGLAVPVVADDVEHVGFEPAELEGQTEPDGGEDYASLFQVPESEDVGEESSGLETFAAVGSELPPTSQPDSEEPLVSPPPAPEPAADAAISFDLEVPSSDPSAQKLDDIPTMEVPVTAEPPLPESPSGSIRIGDLELDGSAGDIQPSGTFDLADLTPVEESPASEASSAPLDSEGMAEDAGEGEAEAKPFTFDVDADGLLPAEVTEFEPPSGAATATGEESELGPDLGAEAATEIDDLPPATDVPQQEAVTLGSTPLSPLDLPPVPALSTLLPRPLAPPRWAVAPEGNGGPGGYEAAAAESSEPASPAGGAKTATLGSLYLDQGHSDDAKEIFEDVLQREPENVLAREGLNAVDEGRQLAVRELLEGFDAAQTGVSEKKLHVLKRYLARVSKPGSANDVS